MDLVESVLDGDRMALSRLLTQVENDTQAGRAALDLLYPYTGKAHLVGVTGAPGTGKSSLVNQLARIYRNPPDGGAPKRVGVVAVDPTSPFTGGAILADRVRMRDLAGDSGVFIRSMATRGWLGGLAATTTSLAQALDAAGFEVILIETVGAGQAEVDIARLAHTTLVVEAPGMGDDIQAIKAGILEIADILVVNKADRPGAENTERALQGMLQLAHPVPRPAGRHHGKAMGPAIKLDQTLEIPVWLPPVQRTVATEGTGITELYQAITRHRLYLEESGEWQSRERERLQSELDALLQAALVTRWRQQVPGDIYQSMLGKLIQRSISPWQAVAALLDGISEEE
jgi:LAO/AO transport system kinase